MDIRLDGRAALVTGGSSGIGAGAAQALAEAGAKVCIQGYAHVADAEALADRIVKQGGTAIAVKADVSKTENVDRMVKTMVAEFGGVDIAFANAAMANFTTLEETTDESWNRHMATNLTGVFLCARRVVPEMKKRGKGKLISTGSIWASCGWANSLAYSVTKAGIHGLTKALAIELAPYKINVNAVAPGNIVTAINYPLYDAIADKAGFPGDREAGKRELAKAYYPIGRLGEPADIANAVVYLASDAADFITGQIIYIDGGYSVI